MRDKPQEALHFDFWRAKQQPPQQRGRRLAAAAVFVPFSPPNGTNWRQIGCWWDGRARVGAPQQPDRKSAKRVR